MGNLDDHGGIIIFQAFCILSLVPSRTRLRDGLAQIAQIATLSFHLMLGR